MSPFPRDWIEPPDHEGVDGELLQEYDSDSSVPGGDDHDHDDDDDDDDDADDYSERAGMLDQERRRTGRSKGKDRRRATRDSSGRALPAAERAPTE